MAVLVRAMLAFLTVVLCSPQAGAIPALVAGAARVSITPDPALVRYKLGGYFAPNRLQNVATGVRDTCWARAVVLRSGRGQCALVSIELCFIPGGLRDAVLTRIADLGIPRAATFFAATHTHSATDPLCLHPGMVGGAGQLPAFDAELQSWFADRIAQAIRDAAARLRPARIGAAQADRVGLNRNRRGEGLTDDTLTSLRITSADGAALASVFVYAAHPTLHGSDNLQVSGDWCGAFQREIEAKQGGSVCLFLNGAEGDASARAPDGGTSAERVDRYAGMVTAKALRLLRATRPSAARVPIAGWAAPARMPSRLPHAGFLFAAAQAGATQRETREVVDRLMPERADVSFLRIGHVLLIGFPGEPTAEIGSAAKAAARRRGIRLPAVVALTNDWLGYLISARQYRAGGYEAVMSFYGPDGGDTLLAAAYRGLARLPTGPRKPGRAATSTTRASRAYRVGERRARKTLTPAR